MQIISLKPQWRLQWIDGAPWLTSEHHHQRMNTEYSALLRGLVSGLDTDTLSDTDFQAVENLNAGGYLTTISDTNSALWELSGVSQQTALDQFAHVTFALEDRTHNGAGMRVLDLLTSGGMIQAAAGAAPRLRVVCADSMTDIGVSVEPMLPLVLNRTRVTVGPMVLPWREHIADRVDRTNPGYLRDISYELSPAMQQLGVAWAAQTVLRFVVKSNPKLVNSILEFDMVNQMQKVWTLP